MPATHQTNAAKFRDLNVKARKQYGDAVAARAAEIRQENPNVGAVEAEKRAVRDIARTNPKLHNLVAEVASQAARAAAPPFVR